MMYINHNIFHLSSLGFFRIGARGEILGSVSAGRLLAVVAAAATTCSVGIVFIRGLLNNCYSGALLQLIDTIIARNFLGRSVDFVQVGMKFHMCLIGSPPLAGLPTSTDYVNYKLRQLR